MSGVSGDGAGTESVWIACGEGAASRRAASPCAAGGTGRAGGGGTPAAAAAIDLLSVLYSLSLWRRSRLARVSAMGSDGSSPMLATKFCE